LARPQKARQKRGRGRVSGLKTIVQPHTQIKGLGRLRKRIRPPFGVGCKQKMLPEKIAKEFKSGKKSCPSW